VNELGPEAAALVKAGRKGLRPTVADRERVFRELSGRIAAGDLPTGAPAPAAPSAGVGWSTISLIVVGLAVGGAVLFERTRERPTRPVPAAAQPSVATAPPPVVPVVEEPPAPAAPALPEHAPSPAAPEPERTVGPRRPSDRLAEEVAILSRAETELHAGRFAGALRLLAEHEREFPRGTLVQERVAAKIHALCGMGRTAEAQTELSRLSPGSLQEGRARQACAPSAK
jgi:hypothetical protein